MYTPFNFVCSRHLVALKPHQILHSPRHVTRYWRRVLLPFILVGFLRRLVFGVKSSMKSSWVVPVLVSCLVVLGITSPPINNQQHTENGVLSVVFLHWRFAGCTLLSTSTVI